MCEVLHINKLKRVSSKIYTLLTEIIKENKLYSIHKGRDLTLTLSLSSRENMILNP